MGRVSKDPKVLAKKERRAKMQELLKNLEVKDMNDINDLFKEMVGAVLKNGLEGELEEELGYSKYDYKNRDTGNYAYPPILKFMFISPPFFFMFLDTLKLLKKLFNA